LDSSHSSAQGQLSEVEPYAGGDIEVPVDVMDHVKAPEDRHPMIQPMPQVEGVVEEQESDHCAGHGGDREMRDETQAVCTGRSHGDGAHGDICDRRSAEPGPRNREVASDPAQLRLDAVAERPAVFGDRKPHDHGADHPPENRHHRSIVGTRGA
jgi:hypothetical protein